MAITRLINASNKLQGVQVNFTNLTKGIYGFVDSVSRISGIEETARKLDLLGKAISRLTNLSKKLKETEIGFGSLSKGIYGFVDSMSRINNLDRTIAQLEKFANAIDKIKGRGLSSAFKNINTSIKAVSNTARSTGRGLTPISQGLGSIKNVTDRIRTSTDKLKNSVRGITRLLSLGFLMRIYHIFRRIGETLYDLIKLYAEYQENINLATVAYNGLENAAKSLYPFVEQISKAFGLNESEVIRSVGLFKQMANAMGLAEETGQLLSETLTKMAYDISSLYNISFERAMSVLQASLAGQTKPINSSSFTWKHVLKNLVNVCKNGVAIIRKVFKQEMAYSYCY